MNQTDAITQWWAGLTSAERQAVLRLPIHAGLPLGLALDLAENGVVLKRVNVRAQDAQVLTAFPDVLREHLARVRSSNRVPHDV